MSRSQHHNISIDPELDEDEDPTSRAKRSPPARADTSQLALRSGVKKSPEEWADPKSNQWDVLRVLQDDDCLAPDHLLELPAPNLSYIKSGKLVECVDDRYNWHPKGNTKGLHPKLANHVKNGTDTKLLYRYYDDMPYNHHIPLAGNPIPLWGNSRHDTGLVSSHEETPSSSALANIKSRSKVSEARVQSSGSLFASKLHGVDLPHRSNSDVQEENFHTRPSVPLVMPDFLKAALVDDWENVTKNQQLVPLPHPHSANKVLSDYLEHEKAQRMTDSPEADLLNEVVAGLKLYFDVALGRLLLYKFERVQYYEIRKLWTSGAAGWEGKAVGDVYGVEHLCRLLVNLPELIAQTNMDKQSVDRLREELARFTAWLGRNAAKYFVTEYETPNQEYIAKARGTA